MPASKPTFVAHRIDGPIVLGPPREKSASAGVTATSARETAQAPKQGTTPHEHKLLQPRRTNPQQTTTTANQSPTPIAAARFDAAHPAASNQSSPGSSTKPVEAVTFDRERWLRLHAAELIRRLQMWAGGLDAREANLNAAYAQQDLRERQFRLQQAEFQAQMDEAQQIADDLNRQLAAQSRRLAFASMA